MRDGICPKCGSSTVYAKENGFGGLRGVPIRIANGTSQQTIITYVCVTCGYLENYVAAGPVIAEISEDWTPIRPQH